MRAAPAFYHLESTKCFSSTELLAKYASPTDETIQNKVFERIGDYCGRPVTNYTLDKNPDEYTRTFYHSFWFSFIVCSTLGSFFIALCIYTEDYFFSPHTEFHRLRQIFSTRSTGTSVFDILCPHRVTAQRFCVSLSG